MDTGLAALVIPTTIFKIGAYTLNYVFLGDFFVIVLAAAMVVNFLVTQSGWKEQKSGINLTTTSAASVFSTTVLQQQLENKEKSGICEIRSVTHFQLSIPLNTC